VPPESRGSLDPRPEISAWHPPAWVATDAKQELPFRQPLPPEFPGGPWVAGPEVWFASSSLPEKFMMFGSVQEECRASNVCSILAIKWSKQFMPKQHASQSKHVKQ
jgi:hypothetical protein